MSNVKDIKFVLSEVSRFKNMGKDALFQLSKQDSEPLLPLPSGAGLLYGFKAYERLKKLSDKALDESAYAGQISSSAVFKNIKSEILDRFLIKKLAVDANQVKEAINSALDKAAAERSTLTHYMPCHLGHVKTPNSFSIGPVTFEQYKSIIEKLDTTFEKYIEKSKETLFPDGKVHDQREVTKGLVEDAKEYYQSFGWVASVTIANCDSEISSIRAKRIIERALDALHLLLSGQNSEHMRVGGPGFSTDKRGHITVNDQGTADVSCSLDWLAHHFNEKWWDNINSGDGPTILHLMGIALDEGHKIPEGTPLAKRFLDGISWYGEAVRDDFPASCIVKHVTAIERILTTTKENLTEVLANRGAAMIFLLDEEESLENLRKRFRDIYHLRSRLVHGDWSPHNTDLIAQIAEAEELTRGVLLRSLAFFTEKGLRTEKHSIKELNDGYDGLIKWAHEIKGTKKSSLKKFIQMIFGPFLKLKPA